MPKAILPTMGLKANGPMEAISLSKADYAAMLPHPARDANKYSRGMVGVIAGSARYTGAPVLATAAARCGAGYVVLATPQSAAGIAQTHLVSIPVVGVPEQAGSFCIESLQTVAEACTKARALVVGPGIGRADGTGDFLAALLAQEARPLVLDADALWFAAQEQMRGQLARYPGAVVFTPHDGEAARLLGRSIAPWQPGACMQARIQDALELAIRLQGVVVLKGPDTLLADEQGRCIICDNAGPELAKAGSGDVLSGMIGAFLAQGMDAIEAAALAVYLHGEAGRLAAGELSDIAVMPEDVVERIGPALVSMER